MPAVERAITSLFERVIELRGSSAASTHRRAQGAVPAARQSAELITLQKTEAVFDRPACSTGQFPPTSASRLLSSPAFRHKSWHSRALARGMESISIADRY